jgi:hypothetical protein
VTHDQAKQIMFGFQILLKTRQFSMQGLTVDTSIYRDRARTVSLRMVYSHKIDACPICENSVRKTTCTFCDHRGSVISKHTYQPVALYDGEGQLNPEAFVEYHRDFLTLLCTHSLWPEDTETRDDFVRPPGEALYTIALDTGEDHKHMPRPTGMTTTQHLRRLKANSIPTSHIVYTKLTHVIQHLQLNHTLVWPKVVIQDIQVTEDQNRAYIELENYSLGCSFCPYAMKDHGGNRIYFLLMQNKLTVYCRSEKAEYNCKKKSRISFDVSHTLTAEILQRTVPPKLQLAHVSRPKDWKENVTLDSIRQPPDALSAAHSPYTSSVEEKQRIAKENHIRKLQELYGLEQSSYARRESQPTNTIQARGVACPSLPFQESGGAPKKKYKKQ